MRTTIHCSGCTKFQRGSRSTIAQNHLAQCDEECAGREFERHLLPFVSYYWRKMGLCSSSMDRRMRGQDSRIWPSHWSVSNRALSLQNLGRAFQSLSWQNCLDSDASRTYNSNCRAQTQLTSRSWASQDTPVPDPAGKPSVCERRQ